MSSKIIFLNGPAGSGKDTVGQALAEHLYHNGSNVRTEKFAKPIKEMGRALFGWDEETAKEFFETPEGKATVIPGTLSGSATYRQLLISISEDFIKPIFGKQAFGQLMVQRLSLDFLNSNLDYIIITDCGFRDELWPVVTAFGPENCYLFRLQREGKTFEGDSRSYVYLEDVPNFDLDNNRTVIEAVDDILVHL